MLTGPFINDPGYEVPENKILVVPHSTEGDGFWKEIVKPLKQSPKRDWFTPHFYYCLPLNIGNQYGFLIQSLLDFDITWPGGELPAEIKFLNQDNHGKQFVKNTFRHGIITVQNPFALKTPPGINLMTIQPPNLFIPGTFAMTGVIETDQIRRDFTFNFKVTVPNYPIQIRKGDPLGAFIPIQRYFVDKFEVQFVEDFFSHELRVKEAESAKEMGYERDNLDQDKPHGSGRRYFNGSHIDGTPYYDHQKRLK